MDPTFQMVGAPKPNMEPLRNHCTTCKFRERCLPMGLDDADMQQLGKIISHRFHVPRGRHLYRMNDSFTNLYAIQLGHFKTLQIDSNGIEHILGFHMAGELLGMDAINTERHHYDSVALEDSEVCAIPFDRLELLFTQMPNLSHHFQRLMSQEITRTQSRMLLLGNMRSEQRMAAFLLNLSLRYEARGYSAIRFQLRMSREDIGNYLALSIESISRLLTGFRKYGLLKVVNRELEIIDPIGLKRLAAGGIRAIMPPVFPLTPRIIIGPVRHII